MNQPSDLSPDVTRNSQVVSHSEMDHHDQSTPRDSMLKEDIDSPSPDTESLPEQKPQGRSKFLLLAIAAAVAIILVVVAIVIPVVLTRKHHSDAGAPSGGSQPSTTPNPHQPSSNTATSGKSGSRITLEDGTTFTYTNNFDGDWAFDPKQPFGPGGQAQSWSKRVGAGEDWVWGVDIVRGVNLGGWLVTEPFVCPAIYEKYINSTVINVIDEWSLSIAMGDNLAKEMEEHYATFITEKDFADIAAAGLNWVRIPIGFWAIETINNEPFLPQVSWKYFLKAIQWARKYGIRIYMDLHALPGSQNGWNHSGKAGSVNFMHGVMGIANAQRTLTYLRIITEFVSQEQYRDVIPVVGIVNEILWDSVGAVPTQSYYFAAYEAIRTATGTGAGAGPYIAIHEGFQGVVLWEGFLTGADRLALDYHPYLAFNNDPSPPAEMALKPCNIWAIANNRSQSVFGVTLGGEFSAAINDCGLWLNGIDSPTYNRPECQVWDDWSSYDPTVVAALKQVTLATMDALQNYFFWTWRIGNSTVLGTSSSPMWHYQLGLKQGWVPQDPREAVGHCAGVLGVSQPFDGTFPAYATGGAGAGNIDPDQVASHVFPPPTMAPGFGPADIPLLPTYTATGTVKTFSAPTFTSAPTVAVGDGWANPADNALAYVPVRGCQYPDAWDAVNAPVPAAPCVGA